MCRFNEKHVITTMKKAILLPSRDSGLSKSIVRIANNWIDNKSINSRLRRRQAIILHNRKNDHCTLRFAIGSGQIKGVDKDTIMMDYDTFLSLGIETSIVEAETAIAIRQASYPEVVVYFVNHPDPIIRITTQISMVGAVLGLLGFVIGLFGIIL